jgi:hypothetical protein
MTATGLPWPRSTTELAMCRRRFGWLISLSMSGRRPANAPKGRDAVAAVADTRRGTNPADAAAARHSPARRVLPTPAAPARTTAPLPELMRAVTRSSSDSRPISGHVSSTRQPPSALAFGALIVPWKISAQGAMGGKRPSWVTYRRDADIDRLLSITSDVLFPAKAAKRSGNHSRAEPDQADILILALADR